MVFWLLGPVRTACCFSQFKSDMPPGGVILLCVCYVIIYVNRSKGKNGSFGGDYSIYQGFIFRKFTRKKIQKNARPSRYFQVLWTKTKLLPVDIYLSTKKIFLNIFNFIVRSVTKHFENGSDRMKFRK